MSKRAILIFGIAILLLATGLWGVSGQEEEEGHPIFTTATGSVEIGTYVAAEAYGAPAVAANDEHEAIPPQGLILPYAIHPNMHIMDIAELEQPESLLTDLEMTGVWSLEVPEGSAAELLTAEDASVAIFMPDVEGAYYLTLTVTDAEGNVGEGTWRVAATNYVGAGGLDGYEPEEGTCGYCHEDKYEAWMETGHSDMFIRAMEGTLSDHYGESCIVCHTTGFNDMETAVNGGFDDVAAEEGWMFPETLEEGNWEMMQEDYYMTAGLANIQCESCHGPGGLHVNLDEDAEDKMIGMGLAYGACAQCHAEDPYHVYPQQWETSAHARKTDRAFTYPVGEDHGSCVKCHSGAGYIDTVNGEEEVRTDYQVITCAVCHDPHDASQPHQLRVFDSVVLPNGMEVADAGPAATCMSCHNARRDANAIIAGALEDGSFSTPHYSTAAELMNNTGGYTWGMDMPASGHGNAVEETCIGCHMAATPGTTEDGEPLPGRHTVGEHTFAMVDADGVENIAACQGCHDRAESFDFEAFRDYDGDGEIETNVAEVEGLREILHASLEKAGLVFLDSHPYYDFSGIEAPDENLYGAVWNLQFVHTNDVVFHNLRYTVGLLQLSIQKVGGELPEGAYVLITAE